VKYTNLSVNVVPKAVIAVPDLQLVHFIGEVDSNEFLEAHAQPLGTSSQSQSTNVYIATYKYTGSIL